jgi:hypothetical protein
VEQIYVALIGAVSLIVVAYIEHARRSTNTRWEENKADHNFVVDKLETVAKSLGISIDRVEKGVERTEEKLDAHIRDHALGEFSE